MKTFDQWFEDRYCEAMVWRDWQTCEMLMDNREMIEYGYNQALEMVKGMEVKLNEN